MSEGSGSGPVTLAWSEIEELLDGIDLVAAMEQGFVADLTGVAVQDVQIAAAVFRAYRDRLEGDQALLSSRHD